MNKTAVCFQMVAVNYDMNDYLPEKSLSTVSLDKMHEEFNGEIPNARVAVKNVRYAWSRHSVLSSVYF